jgi:hypothetical protein
MFCDPLVGEFQRPEPLSAIVIWPVAVNDGRIVPPPLQVRVVPHDRLTCDVPRRTGSRFWQPIAACASDRVSESTKLFASGSLIAGSEEGPIGDPPPFAHAVAASAMPATATRALKPPIYRLLTNKAQNRRSNWHR